MKESKPPDLSKMKIIEDDYTTPHQAQVLTVWESPAGELLTDDMIQGLIETGVSTGRQEVILDDYSNKPVNRLLGGKE
jgi:hypothetical protein